MTRPTFTIEERKRSLEVALGEARVLTAEVALKSARDIREGAARLGVTLARQNDLEKIARDCELFASLEGKASPPDARFIEGLMAAEQGMRLAATLSMAGQVQGAEKLATWVRGHINAIETQDEEAQDHLLELEVAGRLAREPRLSVSIDEPDIVITVPAGQMTVAIKRPRTAKGVGWAIRKARKQIKRSNRKGMIVIGTEALFHHSNDPLRPTVLYRFETSEEAGTEGMRLVKEAALAARSQIEKACLRESAVGGILFFGALTHVFLKPEPGYGSRYVRGVFPNDGYPGARETLKFLAGCLSAS